jgi:hypothetical protein
MVEKKFKVQYKGRQIEKKSEVMKLVWAGNHVVREKYYGKFTRDEVRELAQKQSDKVGPSHYIMVSIPYTANYVSGYWTIGGDQIHLYTYSDSDEDNDNADPGEYEDFQIYYVKRPNAVGGCDVYNDCLWDCLKSALHSANPWDCASKLKDFLGLPRKAKIPVCKLKEIDDKLGAYKLHVTGDYTYTSTKTTLATIKITLENEHYTLTETKRKTKTQVAFKEHSPLVYGMEGEKVFVYDGQKVSEMKLKLFKEMKRKIWTNNFLLINRWKEHKDLHTDLKYTYDEWRKGADELKKRTDGFINMYKVGEATKVARYLFDQLSRPFHPEPIDQDEAEWLNSCAGQIMYGKPYKGKLYHYDVVSMYPSILASAIFKVPLYRGEFKKLAKIGYLDGSEKFITTGIYRCVIEKSGDENKDKLFRYNPKNYYTNYDIVIAKEMGLNIKLLDIDINALIYDDTKCVTGNHLFSKYIKILFPIKQKGIEMAKQLLNKLWGSLCEGKTKTKKILKTQTEDFVIPANADIVSIIEHKGSVNEKQLCEYKTRNDQFVTDYARLKPFLLARGRHLLFRLGYEQRDSIKRMHTDSLYMSEEYKDKTKIGNALGKLKYCGYAENAEVKNATSKVTGFDN